LIRLGIAVARRKTIGDVPGFLTPSVVVASATAGGRSGALGSAGANDSAGGAFSPALAVKLTPESPETLSSVGSSLKKVSKICQLRSTGRPFVCSFLKIVGTPFTPVSLKKIRTVKTKQK